MRTRDKSNQGVMTFDQLRQIQTLSVLVVGCGGIGGHIADQLIRLGVSNLTLIDYDRFEETNLNRQLFCTEKTIGKNKVDVLKKELEQIDSSANIQTLCRRIEDASDTVFEDVDLLVDAVDSPQTKVYLNQVSTTRSIPLLHGACAGWYGQVAIIEPGCNLLQELYQDRTKGIEETLHNPPFAPTVTAAFMISEFVKYTIQKKSVSVNQLTLIDLKNNIVSSTRNEGL